MTKTMMHEGKFLALKKFPSGWEFCERTHRGPIVAVVAITKKKELIVIKQYREPVQKFVMELPAGLVDPGETVLQAAMRELKEETGFRAEEIFISEIGEVASSPGMTSETIWFVIAKGCEKISEGGGVDGEVIGIELVPVKLLPSFIDKRRRDLIIGSHFLGAIMTAYLEGEIQI